MSERRARQQVSACSTTSCRTPSDRAAAAAAVPRRRARGPLGPLCRHRRGASAPSAASLPRSLVAGRVNAADRRRAGLGEWAGPRRRAQPRWWQPVAGAAVAAGVAAVAVALAAHAGAAWRRRWRRAHGQPSRRRAARRGRRDAFASAMSLHRAGAFAHGAFGGCRRRRLTNYVVAHSRYSSWIGQRGVLADLLIEADEQAAGGRSGGRARRSMTRSVRNRANWLISCAVAGPCWPRCRSNRGRRRPRAMAGENEPGADHAQLRRHLLSLSEGRVEIMRIIHRVRAGHVTERLQSLDGSGREFVRNNGRTRPAICPTSTPCWLSHGRITAPFWVPCRVSARGWTSFYRHRSAGARAHSRPGHTCHRGESQG